MAARRTPVAPVGLGELDEEQRLPLGPALITIVLVSALFGIGLFSAGEVALDAAAATLRHIHLLQNTFDPTRDPKELYTQQAPAKAVSSEGALPDIAADGKLTRVSERITSETSKDKLPSPTIFRRDP